MKKVSIKDIAELLGTATSTVSFVLNGKAKEMRISDELATRILNTAKELGYQRNQLAMSLRTGQTKTLGLMVENISNPFFARLARVVEDEAKHFGYSVVYGSTENEEHKGRQLIDSLLNQQVDGLLITPLQGMEPDIKRLQALQKPVVLIDRYFPDIDVPHVLVNNFGGMKEGIKHLLDRGYRNIGFVTVDLALVQMEERLRAFVTAHSECGVASNPEFVLRIPFNASKEEAVQQIIAFISQQGRLDGIVFATNYLGIYGLESIRATGLHIPGDMAVICFDDHESFDLHYPGITVIRQPVEAIAKRSVSLLMQQLGMVEVGDSMQVELAADLVMRQST